MTRVPQRQDVPDEHIRTKDGVVPYRWLERQAIAIESGMSERDATRLANMELASRGRLRAGGEAMSVQDRFAYKMPERSGQEHVLKCWPEYYQAIVDGDKTFEVRKDDRGFDVLDVLLLEEYDPSTQTYTGRSGRWEVTYVLRGGAFGIEPGYVVMGLGQ